MITKRGFYWHRNYSAVPGNILIPAGTKVEDIDGSLFVKPEFFKEGAIERHDAETHGCRVENDNIDSQS